MVLSCSHICYLKDRIRIRRGHLAAHQALSHLLRQEEMLPPSRATPSSAWAASSPPPPLRSSYLPISPTSYQ